MYSAGMTNRNNRADAPEPMRPAEAAKLTGLSPAQLGRMADRGQLTASRPGGTHRRYVRAEIEALAKPEAHR